MNSPQEQSIDQGPRLPGEIVFAVSGEGLTDLAASAQASARVSLHALDEEGADTPSETQGRRFSFDTALLLRAGAQISPSEDGGWLVSGVDPIIFFPQSPDFRSALGLSAQPGAGLPGDAVRPEWLPEFPPSLGIVMNKPLDPVSGWHRMTDSEIVERAAGLLERYPSRTLLPLFTSLDSDDVICLERGRGDRFIVIHDHSTPGFEENFAFESPAHFARVLEAELAAKYHTALLSCMDDDRYVQGINWGAARPGHPEGTVGAHIYELVENLRAIKSDLTPSEFERAQLFIHTHDTFKGEAQKGARILDPKSHASLARAFVEARLGETSMSGIIQFHDELYALWQSEQRNGRLDSDRYNRLVERIADWDMFVTTKLIDSITVGKDIEPTAWALRLIEADNRIKLSFDPWDRMSKILESRGMPPVTR